MIIPSACEQAKILPIDTLIPLEKKIIMRPKTRPKKVILISGPTACGKTTLSLMIAAALGGEIISADSVQVYRGMDIGTAKVPKEDRERIPHYLIDICNLQETFNVVDFYYAAKQCCDSILARDRVPLIVGGSGFYFRALLYGPPPGPPSIAEVRHSLEQEMREVGSEVLYQRLKDFDPDYAASITPRDKHKIVRALEIISITGEKVSQLVWKKERVTPEYDFHAWFLHRPRESLYPRIDVRCDDMLEEGLIDEVKSLEKQGLRSNPSASQAIGYRQCLDFLDSPQTEEDYKKLVQKFKTASHHYAKRQFTWFKKEPPFRWLNIEAHDFEIAADMIMQEYLGPR